MAALALLLAIAVSVYFTIRPLTRGRLTLGMASAPLVALAALILIGIVDIDTVREGLVGSGGIAPWKILIIFFTVAYVSVSTDITGLFDVIAYKIVEWAQGNTAKLFLFFYVFASVLTVFTSNDIVILTLTPIIFYLGVHARLNIMPFLFAEFLGANTLSMMLVIGNPTNIIVADALNISFTSYVAVMAIPAAVAGALTYMLLRRKFARDLTQPYERIPSQARLVSTFGASASAVGLTFMLLTLMFSDRIGVEIWQVTAAFAALFLFDDLILSGFYQSRGKARESKQRLYRALYAVSGHMSDFQLAVRRVPWSIAPFVIVLFIIVQALTETSAFVTASAWLASLTSLGFSIGFMGVLGLILANVINNQPMTILLANLLVEVGQVYPPSQLLASGYALIVASNLGANVTLIGALAGVMWQRILAEKGFVVSYWEFIRVGGSITAVVFTVTLMVLYLEFAFFF